jgi:fatty acid desaturase
MRELSRLCAEQGLFEKTPVRALLYASSHLLVYGLGFWGTLHLPGLALKLLSSLVWGAGIFYVGTWMHDLAHYSVTRSRRLSDVLGLLAANCVANIDYFWWQQKHNRHHRGPNNAERDPDHFTGPYLRTLHLGGADAEASRWLRVQGYYLWLIGLLGGVNVSVQSLLFQFRREERRLEVPRLLLTVLHYAGFFTCMSAGGVPLPTALLLFLCGRLSAGGFFITLGMLNHLGMHAYHDRDADPRAFARQVASTRNLGRSWLCFYVTAGLNHHIEHHLFPSMPRFQHPALAPYVRQLCHQHGIAYRSTSFFQGVREVTRYMNRIGAERWTASRSR